MTALVRHTGRPTREESGEIPPKVWAALTLRAAGLSWKQCSDMTGASYRNLLKWKDLPIAEVYVEEKVKEALAGTYNKLISAGPAVADRPAVDRTGSGDEGIRRGERLRGCDPQNRARGAGPRDA